MKCSNANCECQSDTLTRGTLYLLEFDDPTCKRLDGSEQGFPTCLSARRYFWLCASCSKRYMVKKWSGAGIVLEERMYPTLTSDDMGTPRMDQQLVCKNRRSLRARY